MDVDYRSHSVVAACACFHEWSDEASTLEVVARSDAPAAPYEPGQFWRREMPYLLEVLARLPALPTTVVVDGYVWLDERKSGLGAHLFDALAGKASVIGVAKRPYRNAAHAAEVVRGKSLAPLFVTAVGLSNEEAARAIERMHGPYRVPTLLARVDRLSRA